MNISREDVKAFLTPLSQYYPGFNLWFDKHYQQVNNENTIVVLNESGILGVSLFKKTPNENKIRCVRIRPDLQGSGLGIRLIDKTIDVLEDDKPLVTVSEELLHEYSRAFVNRYNFKLTEVTKGQYRRHRLEYVFNGE